jgi:hypothetical protein
MGVAELFFLRLLISVAVVHAFQVPPPLCCDKRTQQRQWIAAASSSSTTTTTCWDNNLEPLEGIDQPFVQSQWMMSSVVERALLHQRCERQSLCIVGKIGHELPRSGTVPSNPWNGPMPYSQGTSCTPRRMFQTTNLCSEANQE